MKYDRIAWANIVKIIIKSKLPSNFIAPIYYILDSSLSMGSYFRGENLSDFELDELNSGNESGNNNVGK